MLMWLETRSIMLSRRVEAGFVMIPPTLEHFEWVDKVNIGVYWCILLHLIILRFFMVRLYFPMPSPNPDILTVQRPTSA